MVDQTSMNGSYSQEVQKCCLIGFCLIYTFLYDVIPLFSCITYLTGKDPGNSF